MYFLLSLNRVVSLYRNFKNDNSIVKCVICCGTSLEVEQAFITWEQTWWYVMVGVLSVTNISVSAAFYASAKVLLLKLCQYWTTGVMRHYAKYNMLYSETCFSDHLY